MMLAAEKIAQLGARIRALRLEKNIDQRDLAREAGVGLSPLKHLETGLGGQGATLRTFVRVLVALGHGDWLDTLGGEPGAASGRRRTSRARRTGSD